MSEAEKQRLVGNIAASLSQVSREDIIERSVAHFRRADPEFGDRLANALPNAGRHAEQPSRGRNQVAAEKPAH
jgi:catalase